MTHLQPGFEFRLREQALEEHERMARLYQEDQSAFERERKKLIEMTINNPKNEARKDTLLSLQEQWDLVFQKK